MSDTLTDQGRQKMKQSKIPMYATAYAAIRMRKTDCVGYSPEWLNTAEMSSDIETVQAMVQANDALIPHWAADNPLARIAHVKISEIVD